MIDHPTAPTLHTLALTDMELAFLAMCWIASRDMLMLRHDAVSVDRVADTVRLLSLFSADTADAVRAKIDALAGGREGLIQQAVLAMGL